MTVCVGVRDDGAGVWLASDSMSTYGGEKSMGEGKLVRRGGLGLAMAGDLYLTQAILRCWPKTPDKVKNLYEWLCDNVAHVFVAVEDAVRGDEEDGAEFLVTNGRDICLVSRRGEVTVSTRDYAACGCGSSAALGCLWYAQWQEKPKHRAEVAVEAACEHMDGCGLPVRTLWVPR